MSRIILASASPRRLALLADLDVAPVVRPADVDETPTAGEGPDSLAARLAAAKARAVDREPDDLVIAADTVVAVAGTILGKPEDDADARRMLGLLSGTAHHVITGVHVIRGDEERCAIARTAIRFRPVSTREIADYVATGEPMDKAGAFAIQGLAADFVERIDGSHSNVVGLPLDLVARLAGEVGVPLTRQPVAELP
ncbi:Maf family protein [Actinospongicola halichondriae]|uniref:Maf family protein n=1 Tax=Actinospongicola halichondriae TaxID=3236844 RepID=UPI003D41EE16